MECFMSDVTLSLWHTTHLATTWALFSVGEHLDIMAVSCDSFSEDVNREIGRCREGDNVHVENVWRLQHWCQLYKVRDMKRANSTTRYTWNVSILLCETWNVPILPCKRHETCQFYHMRGMKRVNSTIWETWNMSILPYEIHETCQFYHMRHETCKFYCMIGMKHVNSTIWDTWNVSILPGNRLVR